jgi:hypothetical protein
MGHRTRYSEAEARSAIVASFSWAESLRRLGLCPTGGAWRVLKKHAAGWGIPSDHFLPNGRPPTRRPLDEVLVEGSPVRGTKLKERIYAAGLKQRACELCGQGEAWNGRRMALILDHINGVRDDNRLENLRIVCANCNATLETHCGRNSRKARPGPRDCALCGSTFDPNYETQRYCSRACGQQHAPTGPRLESRRAERPPTETLLAMVASGGYEAVGRRFGVTGNAIRKWIRAAGITPPPGPGRVFNPPPRPAPVLTDERASAAVALLAAGRSPYAVAKQLGVSRKTVLALARGKTYRHIARPEGWSEAA